MSGTRGGLRAGRSRGRRHAGPDTSSERTALIDSTRITELMARGPGVNNWNLSLFKNLRLRERLTAQFGQITGARDPRVMQFALRLRF
jgi:hypothetical protein